MLWGDRARIITVQDAFDQKQQRLLAVAKEQAVTVAEKFTQMGKV